MKKREFLKISGVIATGSLVSPLITGCSTPSEQSDDSAEVKSFTPFELPALGYDVGALEPNIDKMTMEIHHGKHHAGYVKKLNAALDGSSMAGSSLVDIMANVGASDTAIRNNGGGHFNHSLFWNVIGPEGKALEGDIANAINSSFGSVDAFKEAFQAAAMGVFGSGWAWLSVDDKGSLFVSNTPNQDNPMMKNIVEQSGTPILGIDVWEHAYYLNYQNKRGDYVGNFFNIINWSAVESNMKALM